MFSLIATIGFAQNRTVTGVVTSADDNQPLVGVSIVVKGTSIGTITDIDGNYSLSVPEKSTLVYSFVGYTTDEIPLGNGSVMNLSPKRCCRRIERAGCNGLRFSIKA